MSKHFEEHNFVSGHTACAGCGQALAARLVVDAAGKNTIVTNATGCLEVFSTKAPQSSWNIPWIHSLFENSAAVGSGVESALRYLGKIEEVRVISQGGDGGTADIGLQALSGMLERGHDILYVCYDNEAYMNCLTIDSLVITKQGLKKILDIEVGEELAAIDLKNYQLVYKKCLGIFDNGIQPIYELKTRHHYIKATPNHPFLVLKRPGRGKAYGFVWKRLDELKPGDELVSLKRVREEKSYVFSFKKVEKGDYKVNNLNPVKIPEKSSPSLMKYLGIYLGDGWVREEKGEVGFALPRQSFQRKEFIKLHKKLFGCKFREDEMYVYINSVNLAKFISRLGFKKGAKNKTIPSWVFTLPLREKQAFIEGLMSSDGYKYNGSWRYVSASFELLSRLKLLADISGFKSGKVHWQGVNKGEKIVNRELLKDTAFGYICISRRKKPDFKKWPHHSKYRNFFCDNKYFTVEKVKEINYLGKLPTLDLRVEDEHNFIANGLVVHNTGIQRSGLTPFSANTTTSPSGKFSTGNPKLKKPLVEICAAHHIPYSASASVGYPQDLQRKVKKSLSVRGPKYLQIHCPCPLGWRYEPDLTLEIARLAVESGLYPLVEYEYGKLTKVFRIPKPRPVGEYLKLQGRFRHIVNNQEEVARVQKVADKNIEYYRLK
ncbi:MAG: hypothetical protein J7K37_05125 [Candidatus Omnitrophica bacterium]|nr:hypothetical protein [Candidatus Omnitrophota bacterium]